MFAGNLPLKMETTACEWGKVYRNIDCTLDIDACLQMETPAGLNEVKMVLGKQMRSLLEEAVSHFRCHLYWARSV